MLTAIVAAGTAHAQVTAAWSFTVTAAETDQNGDPVLTEGGASITATATITNGVTFASAQTVTLAWGDASLTSEYVVGAGNATAISIAAGQASGSLTISSPDTDTTPSYTPPKEHDLTATHSGTEIGSVNLIRLDDEQPPVATIAAVPTTVTEGEDIAIEVRLNLPFDGARFVSFDVTDADSALSGTKVRFNSVFGYRDTIKTITFSADDNSIQNDGARTATLVLYRDARRDYTLGDPSSVVVTVLDNDSPPTVPRNLTATAISETQIDLNWEEPVKTSGLPITGYRIEVSTDDSTWTNLQADTESTDTEYEHTGLTASTTRYYRVSAINDIGTGSASDAASATTRKAAFVATANADGSTTLLEADLTVVSMAHGGGSLDSTGMGYYQLAGAKYGDLDPPAFIFQGTTIRIGAIQTEPGGTCAEDGNKGELTLWDGSGNWDDLGFVKPVLHLGSKTFAFADANEQTASFVKWHCVDDGDIGWSDGAMLTVKIVLLNEPSAPTNLTAAAAYAAEIDLSWNAPASNGGSDITGYRIEVSTDDNAWTDLVADTESTDTYYEHTGLTASTTRYYRVSAINAIGTGTASAAASATTSTVADSALNADGSQTLLTATMTVGQARSSGVTLQTYGYSSGGGYGSLDDADFAIASTTYTVAALVLDASTSKLGLSVDPALGTRHAKLMLHVGTGSFHLSEAAVTSLSAGGASYEWSNPGLTLAAAAEVAVKVVRLHAPGAPTGLTATARTPARIDLEWDAPAKSGGTSITGYRIEVSTEGSNWSELEADTESTDTEYQHNGLTAGATRYYRVSAINTIGAGSASDAASATSREATFVPTENADGSTTVWVATLTVEDETGFVGSGYYNNNSEIGSIGVRGGLDPDLFTYNGVTHVFSFFGISPFNGCGGTGNNALTLWDGFAAKWRSLGFVRPVLHVGTRTFAFKDAAEKTGGFVQFCLAGGAATLGWYDGYTETVKIVLANEPSTPTNLTARATYASEIDLGWDAPEKTGGSPITGYRIEVSTDGNTWTDLVADTESTDTDYRHTGLSASSTRYYQVSAINAVGTGTASATASATTSTVVGSAINADGSETLLTATLTVGQAQSLQTYGYSSGGGYGSLDNTSFFISATTYTVAALVLDATSSPSKLGLSLNPALGTKRANLGLEVGAGSFDLSAAAVASLAGGAAYEWSNPGLTLAAAAEVAVQVVRLHAPGAPTGLAATATTPTRIDLDWEAPATDGGRDITGYRIEVSTDGNAWSDLVADTESADTYYEHTGLTVSTTRYYQVSALNAIGTGTASATASATTSTVADSVLNADGSETLLTATMTVGQAGSLQTHGYSHGGSYGSLDDTDFVIGSTTYTVAALVLDATSSPSKLGLSLNPAPGTRRANLGLEVGTGSFDLSEAAVASLSGGAAYEWSNPGLTLAAAAAVAVQVVRLHKPGAPTGLTATAMSSTQIDLSWNAPATDGGRDITGYRIEVSTDGNAWSELVADTESSDAGYEHTGLAASTKRYYRVSALNAIGTGSASDADSATTFEVDAFVARENADGSTTVWMATLTVEEATGYYGQGGSGYYKTTQVNGGDLDPDRFIYNGVTHTFNYFGTNGFSGCSGTGANALTLWDGIGAKWRSLGFVRPVLHVGTRTFAFKDAADQTPGFVQFCLAGGAATLGWYDGYTEAVKIVLVGDPSAPTNLTARATYASEIDLGWDAPAKTGGSPITGYKIEVSTDDSTWTNLVADTESTDTEYRHTGLTASSTRYYRVSAINAIVTGTASATASATTSTVVGSAVNADGSETLLTATMTVGQAQSLQTYGYSSGGGYGSLDNTSFFISATTYTVAALVLDATSSPSKLGLSLNPALGTKRANLGLEVGAGSFDLSEAAVASLSGGAAYEWSNPGLTLAAAAEIAVQVVRLHAPGAPTGLAATATTPTRIDLDWEAPATDGGRDITGYRIEVSTDGNAWSDLVADTESADTYYEHTGLTASTTRYYQVSALNAIGTGTASATASATTSTVADSVLNADGSETLLTATMTVGQAGSLQTYGYSSGGSYGSLDDTDFVIGSTTYTVAALVLDATSSPSKLGLSLNPAPGTRRAILGLEVGAGSFYLSAAAVTSLSAGGASYEWSNPGLTLAAAAAVAVKVVRLRKPGAPTGLTATATSSTQIDLSWNAPAKSGGRDITGYRIEVSTDGNAWSELVADTESPDSEYEHTGLTASTTRYYQVSALNAIGTGSASDAASATTTRAVFVPKENADGSTTVLEADMTVGSMADGGGALDSDGTGYYEYLGKTGDLDPRSFIYQGSTTRIYALQTEPNGVCVEDSSKGELTLFDGLGNWDNLGFVKPVLHIGSTTFAFADADEQAGAFVQWYCVDDDDVGWSDGAMLTVKIVLVNEPSAPTNLTARATYASEIDLGWDAPAKTGGSPITGYKIEVSPDSNNWTNLVADTESTDTEYRHTGLTVSTTRYYQVSAINAVGTGTASATASATTSTVVGSAINADGSATLLTATMTVGQAQSLQTYGYSSGGSYGSLDDTDFAIGSTTYTVAALVLDATSSPSKLGLSLNPAPGTRRAILGLEVGAGSFDLSAAAVASLAGGAAYEWSNPGLTLAVAAEVAVQVVRLHAPGAPTGLAATATTPTRIDLDWEAPATDGGRDITGYRIEVSTDGNAWSDLVADTESADTYYEHTGLTVSTTRYYQVSALNAIGTGTASATASATTSTVADAALNADGSETLLTATMTVGQAGSLQTYGYSHGGSYGSLDDTDFAIGSTTYTVAALVLDATSSPTKLGLSLNPAPGTRRAILELEVGAGSFDLSAAAVTSLSAGGASYEWSNPGLTLAAAAEVAVKVVRLRKPGAPTGLTATATSSTQIDLDWNAPAKSGGRDITGYRIEVSPDGNAWSELVADTESPDTEYEHTGLTASTTRYYQVSALNAIGTGSASDAASTTTTRAVFVPKENADGSTTVLEADMTAVSMARFGGSLDSTGMGYFELAENKFGDLDPRSFIYKETTTRILALQTEPTGVCVEDSSKGELTLMDGLGNWHNLGFVKPVLHIGSTTFAFADADEQAGAFVQWYCVDDDDVGWSDGAMLTVKIVLVNEPSAPRNLAATVASATEIGLSWAAPAQTGGADITGYEYRYSTDGGDNWGAWTAIASSASLTGYTVSGLDTTSTHTFQLRAVNSSGAGPHADMGETASTDASLSGLSLSAGTLTPAFAAATTSYAATVANTVSRVTVTPVRNHTGAAVAYLDGSDAALADADPNTDHQQVDLVIGPNTIKVQVTAEDGTTVQTYTVVVTRTDAPPVFTSAATADVAENTTAVLTVEADDADSQDSVTGYTLAGGADAGLFTLGGSTGALSFTAAPNFEDPADADGDNDYLVTVRATSGSGTRLLTADQTITITVTDDDTEAPAAPAAPTVAPGSDSTTLSVTWNAPANAGPPITGYDVQYRQGTSGTFAAGTHTGTSTSTSITGLTAETDYEVQVKARNPEGDSAWSPTGAGTTSQAPNGPPAFTSAATANVVENTTAVLTVAASDPDSRDSVTGFSLAGGADAGRFTLSASTGALSFTAAPNFEDAQDAASSDPANAAGNNEFLVTVRATGGSGDRLLTADQTITITVTDDDTEAPAAPAAPTVAPGSDSTTLSVTWNAPANAGPPITGYDVQYRQGTSGTFAAGTHTGTSTSTSITGLTAETDYEVQVKARNPEGDSAWSPTGAGTTSQAPNGPPAFTSAATANVVENTTAVLTVAASDPDSRDSVTGFSLAGGADAGRFTLSASTGALSFTAAPNFEDAQDAASSDPANAAGNNEFLVTVRATGGSGDRLLTADQTITITVTDDDSEAPAAPAAPTVAPGSDSTTLSVTWNAPANAGPPITGYDVQYRQGTSGTFAAGTHTGTSTSTSITGLTAETDYEVQVKARNPEGDSAWSPTGAGTTSQAPNGPPAFTSAATANVVENTTAVLTVAASDPDSRDSVTGFSLAGGADAGRFTLSASTGALSFTAAPNFEDAQDAASSDPANAASNNEYLVTVRATGGSGDRLLTADQTITITVTDDDSEAPAAPAAPTVTPGDDATSLSVAWSAPANAGPAITDYDVQCRQGSSGAFTAWTHAGDATSTTITGLTAQTGYEVQVKARSPEGESAWSPPGAGTTSQAPNAVPAFTSAATASVVENTAAVLTVAASDSDSQDSVTGYVIAGGADAGRFTLNGSTGALGFAAAPDFENAQDADGDNVYQVIVRATGGSGDRLRTGDQTIAVTVTDDDSEAPAAPAAPAVAPGSDATSLDVTWSEPDNTGPPITGYDVQYRQGTSGTFAAGTHTGTSTSTSITGLTAETDYEVQVKARNPEGESAWSPIGTGTTAQAQNLPPAFTSPAAVSNAENTTSVLTVAASDPDSQDSVTGYSLAGGADAARFTLEDSTGELQFATPRNFEDPSDADGDSVYEVIVRATGGSGDRLRTTDQTIAVTVTDDDSEAPAAPAAPTVAPGSDATSLNVTWSERANAGPPITGYDVQYRQGTSGAFTAWPHTGATTATTITGLTAQTEYEVQVKARNPEGDSAWSPSGTGTTAQTPNLPPAFTSPAAVSIAENTTSVLTVAAADPDSQDSITGYALAGGADAARFTLDDSTGELQFATPRNFEDPSDADGDSVYEVIVRATSGSGDRLLTADQTIAVTVTDDDSEAPAAPAAPTVAPGSDATSLNVTWSAPANTGPPITGYDVQYRQGSSGAFTPWQHAGATTGSTITGLTAQTEYEVQVKARNPEGDSAWSPSGTGTTAQTPNLPPAFTSPAAVSIAENTTSVLTVAASDPDSQDSVTGYALAGGADAARFTLDDSTGELQFATPRNFEDPSDADGDSVYEVIVRATSGSGDRLLTGDQTIAVTVTDDDSEAPAAPAAPTVTSGSDATSLNVAWNAPANTGPPISDYDVQYRQGTSGAFTAWQHDGATTGTTITGLTAQTGYEVQVKARNPEGESAWSPSATGTTAQSKAVAENEDRTMFMPQHVDGSAQLRVGGVMVTVEITNGDAPDGMTLILPSSALQQGATITFNVTSQGVPDPPAGFRLGTLTVDIELTGIDLDGTMATVCLPAAEDEPATMYRYDAEAGVWTELESTVKTVDGVRCVCATTDHFSLFALLQRPAPPVAPQRLRVHAEDSSRAELSWMAPAIGQDDMALQGYRVELCTAPCDAESSWESVVADTGSTRTAWTHEGLAPGAIRQHRYRVRAIDTMGQVGEASNVAELPPTEVSGLQATAIDPTTIRLRFVVAYPDGNDVLVRYRKVGDPGTGGVASLPLTHQGEVIFLLEGLQPDTAYEITLDFVDSFDSERAQTIRAITPTVSPVAKAWLARFGRTAAGHVLDAVAERLHGRGPAPSQATIAGHRLRRAADSALAADRWHARLLKGGVQDEMRTLPLHELVADSSFHLAAAATGAGGQPDGGSRWSVWGRGAWSRFAGADEGLDLDGEVLSVTAGADYEQDHLLGGLAVSYSTGAGSFDHPAGDSGELRSTLLGVYPYLRLTLHDRLAVWGLFGYAPVGDLSLESRDAGSVDTGAVMLMGAFGARGTLLEAARTGGFELAAEADGLLLRMRSVAVPELVATVATVRRLRLRLNASWSALPVLGGVLTPALEVGGRYDSGDAETGAGLLVGGSLSYALPAWGLTLTGAGQGLLLHETDGFSEWGAGGSLRLDPGTPGRGLALHVAPSWGTASAGGGTRLWSLPDASDLAAAGHFAPAPRLEAALSYGLDFPGAVDGLLIPYAGVALAADGERTWRLGSRLHIDPSFSLSLESVRTETHAAIDHSLRLTASVR